LPRFQEIASLAIGVGLILRRLHKHGQSRSRTLHLEAVGSSSQRGRRGRDDNHVASFSTLNPSDSLLPGELPLPEAPLTAAEAPAYIISAVDVVERCIQAGAAQAATEGEESGWREVAQPPAASCMLKCTKEDVKVRLSLDTIRQAPDGFTLLSYDAETSTALGAVPLFLEFTEWTKWFPFCRNATCIARWGEDELSPNELGLKRAALWHLVFKIGPVLSVDTVIVAAECPGKLGSTGRLNHYLWSPAGQNTEAYSCLGVELPALNKRRTLLSLRVPVSWSCTSFQPLSPDRGKVEYANKVLNLFPAIEWAIRLFWKACALRAIGVLSRYLKQELGPLDPEVCKYYEQLSEDLGATYRAS